MRGYALVRSLTEAGGDAEQAVKRFATAAGGAGESGTMRLSLGGPEEGDARREWVVSLDEGEAEERPDRSLRSAIEVVTAPETFQRMAAGSYSPVQAFLDGLLRVRGDVGLGKRILRHLAGPEGRVDCR